MILRKKREPVAPDQDAVVSRVLCLSVATMLGAIATGLDEGAMDGEQAAKYVAESHRWLRRESLADALTHGERALIIKPLADWTERDRSVAGRRSESVGVLLWALSAYDDMPAFDARFETLPALVPLLAPTADFRATMTLRPPEQIADARQAAALAHSNGSGESAAERHYALNWLCGFAEDWDNVPTGR